MSDSHPGIATANPDAQRDNEHEDAESGGGPMTREQEDELRSLAQATGEHDAFDEKLTHLEAQKRIELLRHAKR
ncbi:DUF3072 domain-containing protein [Pelagibacterium montanilacus]|uniref:DUF3072 domain-containing protein n=1 Tax=Pelagibacterium montanilacus TaxID=2185280 RepID=UPI000F8C3768|nr:DUF3072 domain-containing protein [Pelagibacterium montanilacus]